VFELLFIVILRGELKNFVIFCRLFWVVELSSYISRKKVIIVVMKLV
jgi:hypothetical protein